LYFVAILRFKSFFSVSACNGVSIAVFLNRRALASIIPGGKNLSFYFSKHFSLINILKWKYSEENNIRECVKKLRPRMSK
jgi:hypothetical protein